MEGNLDKMQWRRPWDDHEGTEARVTVKSRVCVSSTSGTNPGIKERDDEDKTARRVGPWPTFMFNPSRTPYCNRPYLHPERGTGELESLWRFIIKLKTEVA